MGGKINGGPLGARDSHPSQSKAEEAAAKLREGVLTEGWEADGPYIPLGILSIFRAEHASG